MTGRRGGRGPGQLLLPRWGNSPSPRPPGGEIHEKKKRTANTYISTDSPFPFYVRALSARCCGTGHSCRLAALPIPGLLCDGPPSARLLKLTAPLYPPPAAGHCEAPKGRGKRGVRRPPPTAGTGDFPRRGDPRGRPSLGSPERGAGKSAAALLAEGFLCFPKNPSGLALLDHLPLQGRHLWVLNAPLSHAASRHDSSSRSGGASQGCAGGASPLTSSRRA